MESNVTWICLTSLLLTLAVPALGQPQRPEAQETRAMGTQGLLISPAGSKTVFMQDFKGTQIREWALDRLPAGSPRLLRDGGLLHIGSLTPLDGVHRRFNDAIGRGGLVERWSPGGTPQWRFAIASDKYFVHHDALAMPNGNVLMLVWRWRDSEAVLAAGRRPEHLQLDGFWTDEIWEVEPAGDVGGTIVWQWNSWEYRVQDLSPEISHFGARQKAWHSLDLNQPPFDTRAWANLKRLEYDPVEDVIAVWSESFNEVWLIDHRQPLPYTETDLAQTAAKSAQGAEPLPEPKPGLLARFGNPAHFDRKVNLQDMRISFADFAFVKSGERSDLALLHGYRVKGKPVVRGLSRISCSSLREAAAAAAPGTIVAAADMVTSARLGLSAEMAINSVLPLPQDRWILADSQGGSIVLAEAGLPPRQLFQGATAHRPDIKPAKQLTPKRPPPMILRPSVNVDALAQP